MELLTPCYSWHSMFPMQAWSNNEIIKGALLVLKFSFRLTSFRRWAVIIQTLSFVCAPVWGSWLKQQQDIFCFGGGEPIETSWAWKESQCQPERQAECSVTNDGWCLRGVWGTASAFALRGRMRGKKSWKKSNLDWFFCGLNWPCSVWNFSEIFPSCKGNANLKEQQSF